jgi:hypothetical protein
MKMDATFSPCGMFRYTLERYWNEGSNYLLTVMLNPSTADHTVNDPTITRVITRAKMYAFDGVVVCNLYAFRSPYPARLLERYATGNEVVGRENDDFISAAVDKCNAAFVAWGNHKLAHRRDQRVLELLRPLADNIIMLQLTKDGFPKHPLHIAYSIPFIRYTGRFSRS